MLLSNKRGSIALLFQALFLKPWISGVSKKHFRMVALKPNKDLAYMNKLFEASKLKPVIDGPYKLDEVREAFRIFSKGEHKGKMVITIRQSVNTPLGDSNKKNSK